jgi:hypothetical protein
MTLATLDPRNWFKQDEIYVGCLSNAEIDRLLR